MGCDIHAHFELKIKGEWKYYGEGDFDRNYLMFAKLAGVRDRHDEIDKIDKPRGLPEDITEMTKIHNDVWDSDGHSHSWVSSVEYSEVIKYLKDEAKKENYRPRFDNVWLFGNSFYDFHEGREDFPEFVEDFRMVFWFDN